MAFARCALKRINMLNRQPVFKKTSTGICHQILIVFGCFFFVPTAALTQHVNVASAGATGEKRVSVTEPMSDPYVADKKIKPSVTHITFYRPQQGYMPGVASLEVNGRYHGALQLGSYSELCLPAGTVSIAARMTQVGAEIKGFHDATTTLILLENQSTYLRLVDFGEGRARLSQVPADIALDELKGTRRQVHVRSRVPSAVECVESNTKIAQKKEPLILIADGIFNFGSSEINVSNANVRQSIDDLIGHIKQTYSRENNVMVSVVGHADLIGNAEVNKRLSAARAEAIRYYMIKNGLLTEQVTSQGVGSEQPVIKTCGTEPTPKNILCNKPNRRVVVNVQTSER
jgi:OmpA-OmpF porin, OOP family